MRTVLLGSVLWVVAVASSARGAEPVVIESPELTSVRVVNDQTIELRRTIEREVVRTVTVGPALPGTVIRGTIEPATRTETGTVIEHIISQLPLAGIKAWRVSGERVPAKVLAAEVREPTLVILLRANQRLDPACAKLFKPEVLVVQLSADIAPRTVRPPQIAPQVVFPQPLPTR